MPLHLPELFNARREVTAKEIYPLNQYFQPRTVGDNLTLRRKLGLQAKEYPNFKVWKSGLFPNTELITYKAADSDLGHQVSLTKIGDTYEYFDSVGKSPYDIPVKEVRDYVLRKAPAHEGIKHQGSAPTCVRHGITRACFEHMPRADYDKVVLAGMRKYGLSADAVVHGLTDKLLTLSSADLKASVKPEPPKEFKKGGIVKKSK